MECVGAWVLLGNKMLREAGVRTIARCVIFYGFFIEFLKPCNYVQLYC